ncbi:hypothetical protein ACHAQC_000402 [Fusarium culmorum]
MASYSLYEKYKTDTQFFVSWLANETKLRFLSSNTTNPGPAPQLDVDAPPTVNGFVPRAKYLASQNHNIPYYIFSALDSAIRKRKIARDAYRASAGAKVDPALAESDRTHQHFTNTLEQCFDILGGAAWTRDTTQDENLPTLQDLQDDISRSFAALNIQNKEASSEEEEEATSSRPTQRRRPGKGKKKGKSRKAKGKQPAKGPVVHEQIPLERLLNIDGQDERANNFMLAVHSAAQQWIELRWCTAYVWKEAVNSGVTHNTAVAAATSKVAFSMVRRTHAAMLADFAGNDSYQTIVRALARGDVSNAQGTFQFDIANPNGEIIPRTIDDIEEQFLYHVYKALKAFLDDFRLNRTGKPTRNMTRRIASWDPKARLDTMTHDERLTWRHHYIIKWLYDLVNCYSAAQLNANRDSDHPKNLEDVDWAVGKRTLFGLNEFAADITRLAMQDARIKIETLIQPHHVFQLQCIVDAFTISKGWLITVDSEHVMEEPADFKARRDIDKFFDCHKIYSLGSYHKGIEWMCIYLKEHCEDFDDLVRGNVLPDILDVEQDFRNYLGQHIYAKGQAEERINVMTRLEDIWIDWEAIEPSRFQEANGLHEYSPFLCGASLEEALSISFKQMMWLWQEMQEPVLILQLYRFLKQGDYIEEPVPLWEALEILFKKCAFPKDVDGQTDAGKITATMTSMKPTHLQAQGRRRDKPKNVHETYDISWCTNFNRESALSAYRKADWNHEALGVLDTSLSDDLDILKSLGTKDDNEGDDEDDDENAMPAPLEAGGTSATETAGGPSTAQTTTQTTSPPPGSPGPRQPAPEIKSDHDVALNAEADFLQDVCGFSLEAPMRPLSGINYPIITHTILGVFAQIEKELEAAGNLVYLTYYDETWAQQHGRPSLKPGTSKRGSMFISSLSKRDQPCVELFEITADVLQRERRRIWEFTYWEDHALSKKDGK